MSYTRSGIPVIVENYGRGESQGVALSLFLKAGSRDEPAEYSGISHLLEHVLFRGTENRTSREISEEVENAGGEINGFTGKELTCYYTLALRETFDQVTDVLFDLVSSPLIDEESLELEKQIVGQEVTMLLNEPDQYIHGLLSKVLWEDHPMALMETGNLEAIQRLDTSDMREFYERYYLPNNMVIAACGALESEEVVDWANRSLNTLDASGEEQRRTVPSDRSSVKVFPREGDNTYVGMGFPGYPADAEEKYSQKLLEVVLGSGMSSRLFQRVREREGLTYSIYCHSRTFSDCGLLGIFFSSSSQNLDSVLKGIGEEIHTLKSDGLLTRELDRAKRLVRGTSIRKLESSKNRMFRLGKIYALTGELTTIGESLTRIEEVTEEDIIEVADELLLPDAMSAAVYTDAEIDEGVFHSLKF